MENSPEVSEDAPGGLRKWWWVVLILVVLAILGTRVWYFAVVPVITSDQTSYNKKFMEYHKSGLASLQAMQIEGAVSFYNLVYGKFPIDSPDADWMGTTAGKDGLVAVLVEAEGQDVATRKYQKINCLDGVLQAKMDDSGKMVYGMDAVTDPLKPAIYDPWGQPFIVIMDTDKDGVIANPLKAGGVLPISFKKPIVYSTGPPNADGTRNTDEAKFITSWQ